MVTPRIDRPRARATPLDPEHQVRLRAVLLKHGAPDIIKKTGLSLPTLTALAAGLGCHESSKRVARNFICEGLGAGA